MILLVAILALVCFIVLGVMFFWEDGFLEKLSIVSTVLAFFIGLAICIMVIVAIMANWGIDGQIASMQAEYDSLVYQFENDIYENDNDLGKSELYTSITKWNKNVAEGKALQYDMWIGIFYPDIYDNFELIELR